MRILDIRETTVAVGGAIRNAAIGFDEMTASAVAIVTDGRTGGAPLIGYGLDSIGRYGHGGLLRERFIPRLLAAAEDELCDPATGIVDPVRAWRAMMRNEKPGGHGERSAAVGVLDAALWDLAAKADGVALRTLLARRFGDGTQADGVPADDIAVYGAGGHYRAENDLEALETEVRAALAMGFRTYKIKTAAATEAADRARIEAALDAMAGNGRLAVDANAALTAEEAHARLAGLAAYDLAWIEEPGDPLDFELMRTLSESYAGPLATGENLFSAADATNLLRYGGLRPDRDLLQFDVSLSYGIPEYLRIVAAVEAAGWSRTALVPHAGHLFAANVVAGLGLGAHEAAPDPTQLFGGFPDDWSLVDGRLRLGEAPGVGFEAKANAMAVLGELSG